MQLMILAEESENQTLFPSSVSPLLSKKILVNFREVVADVVKDMTANKETLPEAIANKQYNGRLTVRIPTDVHRNLAIKAAESGIDLNRLTGSKLSR